MNIWQYTAKITEKIQYFNNRFYKKYKPNSFLCTFGAKVPKRGGFDSPAPLNDNGFALDPFWGFFILEIKVCAIYQIQNLHAVVIHELIVLTPKIIVQQRKLITMILPLFLDFLSVHICGTKLHIRKDTVDWGIIVCKRIFCRQRKTKKDSYSKYNYPLNYIFYFCCPYHSIKSHINFFCSSLKSFTFDVIISSLP